MNEFVRLDLEIYKPTVEIALKKFKDNLKMYKSNNVKCVYVVHGYGSHGKGGLIRDSFRKELKTLKDQKIIKKYIFGEDFNIMNNDAYVLKHTYQELEHLFHTVNKGVTVIEL